MDKHEIEQSAQSGDGMVLITRVFRAPRAQVFEAWTDPAMLPRWHAPHGCRIEYKSLEIRTGGHFHCGILPPVGPICWCRGTYQEVTFPSRLVFTMAVANEAGELIEPIEAGMDPAWPKETTVTVTFDDLQDRTRVTLRQTVSESLAKKTGAHPSWLQMLDRLESELVVVTIPLTTTR